MENDQKDFMKNRPVVSNANQAKDVYGPMKKSSISLISLLLSAVLLACIVYNFIMGQNVWGWIFTAVFSSLLLSIFVSAREAKNNKPVEKTDHPDAIFKEHEE